MVQGAKPGRPRPWPRSKLPDGHHLDVYHVIGLRFAPFQRDARDRPDVVIPTDYDPGGDPGQGLP